MVHGLAGEVNLPSDRTFQGLVAEILGHFGSSEGYVSILHQCARAYPSLSSSLRVAIPLYFGTAMVPVDLSPLPPSSLRLGAIGQRVVLIPRLPFTDVELTNHYGMMEFYNAMDLLQSPQPPPSTYRFSCEWVVGGSSTSTSSSTPRPFHGLACYVIYGDKREGPYESSNDSLPHASTNWCNVLIPVGNGRVTVAPEDVISVRVACHVGQPQPCYTYHVLVRRAGQGVVWRETIKVDYCDLVCRFDTIRNWKRRAMAAAGGEEEEQ